MKDFAVSLEECCACGACVSACPTQPRAMQLVENDEGFLYPQIDEARCIGCHACERACFYRQGMTDWPDRLRGEREAYAVQMRDVAERLSCQSGGLSSLLTKQMLARGGVVYGCVLDEEFRAVYSCVTTAAGAVRLRGSKYVQADTRDIYRQVRDDLQAGRSVLFIGTPCYAEGLLSYLHGGYREQLVTADIICHGVPSPRLWQDFLTYRQQEVGQKVTQVRFRDKANYGWHSHVESVWFGAKRCSSTVYTDIFYSHMAMRESCLQCRFTSTERHSDITMSDCWGLERNQPEFDDNRGTSLAIINTETGRQWFELVVHEADVVPVKLEDYMQPQLQHPIACDRAARAKFWQDYAQRGYRYIFQNYGHDSGYWRLRRRLKKVLRQIPGARRLYHIFRH